ncbi:MAG: electron transfer flavoprotein-ubiquinone oxidoreductase [Pseudomonadota bacterium]
MSAIEREAVEYDVVIVGAGPAGLSAAIRLKQLGGDDLSVVLLEKGSEVGAHILSGAVLDTAGLDALLPDWRETGAPLHTPVTEDRFYMLGPAGQMRIPTAMMPPLMSNHGTYIVSMGNVCRWLAERAEELGVEIFPGMAASEIVSEDGVVKGVVAGEFGRNPDGTPGDAYEPGMELHGKYVLIAEGARGSLAKQLIRDYALDRDAEPQKYGLGMKELWEVKPEHHRPGQVTHTMGWPLGGNAGGGSFMYHLENNQVYLGFVVHLNYENPYLYPYAEFQRFKHHPLIAETLEGGKRVAYGARAIVEGGWQSLPELIFPGGALLGCAAGMVNVPRIKGNHNAMLSGKAAGEAAYAAISEGRAGDKLEAYATEVRTGAIAADLRPVRNVKPLWSDYGMLASLGLGGVDMWLADLSARLGLGKGGHGFCLMGTMRHRKSDAEATGRAKRFEPIEYPKPDGVLSFDRLTNVAYSFTNHEESQPAHLRLTDPSVPIAVNLEKFAEPAERYCPAGVYEVVREDGAARFQINFQNCVHCKTCDIKDPSQNITWTVPQGGDGPNYPNM